MTTEPLLTISAFARAVDLAPSTLRYYDEAGLLPPAEVDPRTGYRFYTPDLERRATLLRRMRDIGLPVESMRAVLGGTPEQAERVLRSHVAGAQDSARLAADVAEQVLAALGGDPEPPAPVAVTVDGAEVAAALRRVAAAADAVDGPLHGVLLDVAADGLTVVATDRYWMACWRLPVAELRPAETRAFVPLPEVEHLAARLDRCDTATVTVERAGLRVDDEPVPTGPDRFPAYRLVLPPPGTGRATLSRDAVRDAVDAGEGLVRVAVRHGQLDVGGYADAPQLRLPATVLGAPVTLWFSRELLVRVLDTLVGEHVTLAWLGPERAVRLSPVEQRRLDLLLMPCRPPA